MKCVLCSVLYSDKESDSGRQEGGRVDEEEAGSVISLASYSCCTAGIALSRFYTLHACLSLQMVVVIQYVLVNRTGLDSLTPSPCLPFTCHLTNTAGDDGGN